MIVDEKQDADHIEKAYDSKSPIGSDIHPEQDWAAEEEAAIVKKADWRVFPMLCPSSPTLNWKIVLTYSRHCIWPLASRQNQHFCRIHRRPGRRFAAHGTALQHCFAGILHRYSLTHNQSKSNPV